MGRAIEPRKSVEHVMTNSLYVHYRFSARTRSIPFDLTWEQFSSIIINNCFYGGCVPSNTIKYKNYGYFVYSGVDRLDNTKGYVLNNCVPCCKLHNDLKNGVNPEMVFLLNKLYTERGIYAEHNLLPKDQS